MMRRLGWILTCTLSLTLAILAISCGSSKSQQTNNQGVSGSISVSVSPTSANLACSAQQQFTATVTGGSNQSVNWTVDNVAGGNSSVGTISSNGLYTAPAAPGNHNITAISVADATKSATATATVSCKAPVISVSISPTSVTLSPHQTQQFTATVTGTTNTAVKWSVDGVPGGNSTTGTISTSGLYTAPASGNHKVTATSVADPTKSASAQVTVNIVVSGTGVFTQRIDNARTGLNPNEGTLTPSNVNASSFGLLANHLVDGMVYGQPLYVSNVSIPGQGTHNVIYVVTENDSVYAFDADSKSNTPLWMTSFLGPNVVPVPTGDVNSTIFPVIGITCTPVIDPTTGTIYMVAFTKENGTDYVQRLHALDITTGAEKPGSPVVIQASVNGTGAGNDGQGHVIFNPKTQLQRAALLLLNGVVYIAWSSHGDTPPYHGWIMGYNASTLQQVSVWNTTPDGSAGSIWHSGTGLSADSAGNIYAITANGDFDGNRQFSDSFVKLGSNLALFDYFTPFNEQQLAAEDNDLGSGGMLLVPGTRLGIGAGKEGSIYVVNLDNMGHFNPNDNSQIVQFLPDAVGGNQPPTDNNFSTPAFFNGFVYFIGENDQVRQFQLVNGLLTTSPVALSPNIFGHQGAQPVVSANGTSNGIMWAIERIPGNNEGGVLHAYDANNVANELYNSTQAGTRDQFGEATKFSVPTVINGKVYVGTQNSLAVFGLLQ